MAFDATKFKAKYTPARPNRFEVVIPSAPNSLKGFVTNPGGVGVLLNEFISAKLQDLSFLTLRAKTADLPAVSVEQAARFTNGPVRQVPAGNMFQPMLVEFYEDDNYQVRNFFDTWVRSIHQASNAFRVKFYDDCVINVMHVYVYNEKGIRTRQYTFHEVYPSSVNPTQMAWDTQNSATIIPVEFTYHNWTMVDL